MFANLEGVIFEDVIFDETTLMPDIKKWTPDTDMRRFTDPNHPQFWRLDKDKAYSYESNDLPHLNNP